MCSRTWQTIANSKSIYKSTWHKTDSGRLETIIRPTQVYFFRFVGLWDPILGALAHTRYFHPPRVIWHYNVFIKVFYSPPRQLISHNSSALRESNRCTGTRKVSERLVAIEWMCANKARDRLGTPETSLSGRRTRTARSVRRSKLVVKPPFGNIVMNLHSQ